MDILLIHKILRRCGDQDLPGPVPRVDGFENETLREHTQWLDENEYLDVSQPDANARIENMQVLGLTDRGKSMLDLLNNPPLTRPVVQGLEERYPWLAREGILDAVRDYLERRIGHF